MGSVIDTLIKKYGFSREEFLVITESGHLMDDEITDTPALLTVEGMIRDGDMQYSDIVGSSNYCIHPKFLSYNLERSLSLMKLSTIDVNLLSLPVQNIAVEHNSKEIEYRISKAFEFYEEMILVNKLKSYGISTTEGHFSFEDSNVGNSKMRLTKEENQFYKQFIKASKGMPMHKILEIAHNVGGRYHGFRYIFSPFSCDMVKSMCAENISMGFNLGEEGKIEKAENVTLMDFCTRNSMNFIGQHHKYKVNNETIAVNITDSQYRKFFSVLKNAISYYPAAR